MCCSTSFIKHVLSFFSYITTGLGIVGIVFGTTGFIKIGGIDFGSWNWAYVAPIALLSLGCLSFIIGIIGIVGAAKNSRCCLCM